MPLSFWVASHFLCEEHLQLWECQPMKLYQKLGANGLALPTSAFRLSPALQHRTVGRTSPAARHFQTAHLACVLHLEMHCWMPFLRDGALHLSTEGFPTTARRSSHWGSRLHCWPLQVYQEHYLETSEGAPCRPMQSEHATVLGALQQGQPFPRQR